MSNWEKYHSPTATARESKYVDDRRKLTEQLGRQCPHCEPAQPHPGCQHCHGLGVLPEEEVPHDRA